MTRTFPRFEQRSRFLVDVWTTPNAHTLYEYRQTTGRVYVEKAVLGQSSEYDFMTPEQADRECSAAGVDPSFRNMVPESINDFFGGFFIPDKAADDSRFAAG